MQQKSICL